jgi:hypothetical protein
MLDAHDWRVRKEMEGSGAIISQSSPAQAKENHGYPYSRYTVKNPRVQTNEFSTSLGFCRYTNIKADFAILVV